jgi:hypothetical protein
MKLKTNSRDRGDAQTTEWEMFTYLWRGQTFSGFARPKLGTAGRAVERENARVTSNRNITLVAARRAGASPESALTKGHVAPR